MKRIILSAAALVIVSGMFAGAAEARNGNHGNHGGGRVVVNGHYRTFPVSYRNWGRVWYSSAYRCNFYFDVGCNEWFYFYAPQQQYLPVTQIAVCPPTITIVNTNNNVVNVGNPPPLPAPPALPAPIPGYQPGM
jgi:hypothetical protein